MKFRTEVHIPESGKKLAIEDKVFSIGSCFATEISDLLEKGQLQTLNNPFGTIFNPYSIANALQKLHDAYVYSQEDLISFNDEFISLDHHSGFNTIYAHRTLERINGNIQEGNQFLQEVNWVIITYGTSYIYEFLPKEKLVANCHKIPQKFFKKRLLTQSEIEASIEECIAAIKDICPKGVQILFTVSPVRHTKDGMVENQVSKSKLITAIHEVILKNEDCFYLPIYELVMDDLRDYRFYKDDLIHPNAQAINYIFEKFGTAFFSEETKDFVTENFKISKSLQHKSSDEDHPKYLEFKEKLNLRIVQQQAKVKHKIFAK